MKNLKVLFFIARKYLVAKKSFAIINIVTFISLVGVAVGTMALFVVLSVFNGFEDIILNLFNNFHADFKIEAREGKTFAKTEFPEDAIRRIEGIHTLTYVIEDLALARYDERQQLVTVKAVSEEYLLSPGIDSIIIRGQPKLHSEGINYAILGVGVDYVLGINPNDFSKTVSLYVPKRTAKASVSLSQSFVSEQVIPAAVFSVQQEYDEQYVIIPLETGKHLFEYDDDVTSVEITLHQDYSMKQIRAKLEEILSDNFVIKDRYQQQEFIYKILKSEKLAIFLILSFILIIATFNVIGTLSMIILEKRKDIAIFSALGAPLPFIRRLFVTEGFLIIGIGAVLGLIGGIILCWLQQHYGLLRLGGPDAGFIVSAYPVKMKFSDVGFIALTVLIIGFISSLIPSLRINYTFTTLNEHQEQ